MSTLRARVSLLAIIAVLAVVAIGLLVLWSLPALLTQEDSLNSTERMKAQSDVRTALVAFLIAVGAAGTLAFTGRTYVLNRRGQQIDRYSTAVGQLHDGYAPVRIGALYALGRVGADSTQSERDTVVQVLAAFVRLQSQKKRSGGQDRIDEDVQAALDAVGPLLSRLSIKADLEGADLRNADLSGIPADRVLLSETTELSDSTGFGPPITGDRHTEIPPTGGTQ